MTMMMTKKTRYILACDPGAKGNFCILDPVLKKTKFKDNSMDLFRLYRWLERLHLELRIDHITIEDVHSLFGMSAKSNFSFGWNVGVVNSLPIVCGLEIVHVQPKVWQKAVGVYPIVDKLMGANPKLKRNKAIKLAVADRCNQLYPDAKIRGLRGGLLDGRSDALMMAHWTFLTRKERV